MKNNKYIIKVSDFQPELLGKPSRRLFIKSESLEELPIITRVCELWSTVTIL